jgi:hypothetical protein
VTPPSAPSVGGSNATFAPVTGLPFPSVTVTVTSDVDAPSAISELESAASVAVLGSAVPGSSTMIAESAIAAPSSVPVISTLPVIVPAVNVAV